MEPTTKLCRSQRLAPLQLTITGPANYANLANTVAWQYTVTQSPGQSTVNIYLVVNGSSRYQLAINVPIAQIRVVTAKTNWNFAKQSAV